MEAIRLKSGASAVAPIIEQNGDKLAEDSLVDSVTFPATMTANAKYTIELPPQFKDAAGRTLSNANMFPWPRPRAICRRWSSLPPRLSALSSALPKAPALLPVTLRNVEPDLAARSLDASVVRTKKGGSDADIIAWLNKVERYNDYSVERKRAQLDVRVLPPVINDDKHWVQSRMLSLLDGQNQVQMLDMPKASKGDPRPFEVVGIPMNPGFQVVEIASPMLGKSLLDEGYGAGRTMYVRTSVLVTNLAVHFKLGRESSIAWVTSLDKGKAVPGATVQISDCGGRAIASAVTNEQGVVTFKGWSPAPPMCRRQLQQP